MALEFNLVNHFVGNVGSGDIDLDTDTFKAVLSNTAIDAEDNQLSDVTQIANGGGYTTGGVTLTGVTWTEPSTGIWRFDSDDFEWVGTSGGFGPSQYVYIYSDSSTDDLGVGWYDFGSEVTIPEDGIFRVVPGINGHIEFEPEAP